MPAPSNTTAAVTIAIIEEPVLLSEESDAPFLSLFLLLFWPGLLSPGLFGLSGWPGLFGVAATLVNSMATPSPMDLSPSAGALIPVP